MFLVNNIVVDLIIRYRQPRTHPFGQHPLRGYIIFHTILKIGVDDSINYLFAAHAEKFQIGLIDFIDVNRACAASALVAQLMLDLPSGSKRARGGYFS